MGLIRAVAGAVSGTLKDQYKEWFTCESLPNNVLAVRGVKNSTGFFNNNKGSDNVITKGSGIVVADGQCMVIVANGKVVEVCAEPGVFTYDSSTESSIFAEPLGDAFKHALEKIVDRVSYAGLNPTDQRVYYFNTKEILDNKFGTPNPIPFAVVDSKRGIDVDVSVQCSGTYSFRVFDPVAFYTNVCGNISQAYTKETLQEVMRQEFISALTPAIGSLSKLELRPSDIPVHNAELEEALNAQLDTKWAQLRGIEVVNVAITTLTLPKEDADRIKAIQLYSNPNAAAARITDATATAMIDAANNPNGAANTIYAVNGIAQNANAAAALYAQGQTAQPAAPAPATATGWTCECGTVNTGKFCSECGKPNPAGEWTCSKCGTVNKGKFCSECGTPRQ